MHAAKAGRGLDRDAAKERTAASKRSGSRNFVIDPPLMRRI